MKIVKYKLKNEDILYYLAKSVRTGKQVKTINIEKLGKHSELILNHKDPLSHLKNYAKKRTEQEKENFLSVKLDMQQEVLEHTDQKTSHSKLLNIGYFFLNEIYKDLKLDVFFKGITGDTKIAYNPHLALKFLTFARILEPKSKLGTFDDFKNYYEKPKIKLQDIYKTLDLISDHLDQYQTHLYRESNKISKRNTTILYYDCTNYFFEIQHEDELRKYGQAKDHKPNPLVQMGLFMDGDGIPLAFSLNPGNTNEQQTTLPLERKIVKDFELSNFIYVSDGGLNSNETRLYNAFDNRDYIVTQSLKKLKTFNQSVTMYNCMTKYLS